MGDTFKPDSTPQGQKSFIVARPLRLRFLVEHIPPTQQDLCYTHALFLQCFLPHRTPRDRGDYVVSHGNVSLAISPGCLADPSKPNRLIPCEVPSGPKARLILAYINNQAIRSGCPEVPLGSGLREFMRRNEMPVGGANCRELVRQLRNLAAANFTMGLWKGAFAMTRKASIAISPGCLADPSKPNRLIPCEVPSGPKARLILAYINNQAIRSGCPEVALGSGLREFMRRNEIPIGGANCRELVRQLRNLAAANFTMGLWKGAFAMTRKASIACESLWLNGSSKGSWPSRIVLTSEYFGTLEDHRVPLDFRALAALQTSPRAMDVYCFLAYRLHRLTRRVRIPLESLHPVFGAGVADLKNFRPLLRRAIEQALTFYPQARSCVAIRDDRLVLDHARSPIPTRAAMCGRAKKVGIPSSLGHHLSVRRGSGTW